MLFYRKINKIFEIKGMFYNSHFVRKCLFPILRNFNFEISIKHHYTFQPFKLNLWDHKGYWFYGKKREKEEIEKFYKMLQSNDTIFEIGAHIGYITQIFEDILACDGLLLAAEPTPLSFMNLKKNTTIPTILVNKAITNTIGAQEFYSENFGGFTNSLDGEFTKAMVKVLEDSQGRNKEDVSVIVVETTTVDALAAKYKCKPTFLKIDVEGSEYNVLQGAKSSLQNIRCLMVEVSKNSKEILSLLGEYGLYPENRSSTDISDISGNIFFTRR
jgi:FkbM family methyltransferase